MAHIPSYQLPVSEFLILSTMTIASSDRSGEPHAAAVYFAAGEDLNFYFFSDPLSQHGQDFVQRPQAAVAIYPDGQDWQDIRGLQLRGDVRIVYPGPEWEIAWVLYSDKFPFVAELKELVARNQLYVFIPTWVRLVDNRRGFGFKQEWHKVLESDNPAQPVWQRLGNGDPEIGAVRDGA